MSLLLLVLCVVSMVLFSVRVAAHLHNDMFRLPGVELFFFLPLHRNDIRSKHCAFFSFNLVITFTKFNLSGLCGCVANAH